MQKVQYEVVSSNTIDLKKSRHEKMISYYSNYLDIRSDSAYVIYYPLPINSIYWTIGFHKDDQCLKSVNMGKYKTTEKGDILAILIGNNKEALEAVKIEATREHNDKNPYRRLIFHQVKVSSDFYIHLESYSNKFIHYDISMKIKKYILDKIDYEDFQEKYLIESETRPCENIEYFNGAKTQISINSDKFTPIKINTNTNEINSTIECFTNRSEIIEVNQNKIIEISTFRLIAVDHFKSRAALHSHVMFYNGDTDLPFKIEITGEISDRLNKQGEISIRDINFIPPEHIKRFYVIERIYYDFVTGGKVDVDTIIPMEIYKVL